MLKFLIGLFKRIPHPDHNHTWELVAKTYSATNGVTSFLWRCLQCPEFKTNEMMGTDENVLEELAEKSKTYGPQYVEINGEIFVVAKFIPSQQHTIPVK